MDRSDGTKRNAASGEKYRAGKMEREGREERKEQMGDSNDHFQHILSPGAIQSSFI